MLVYSLHFICIISRISATQEELHIHLFRATRILGTSANLIKPGTDKLTKVIKYLFKNCINAIMLPSECKVSWIRPIRNKGRKYQCDNCQRLSTSEL